MKHKEMPYLEGTSPIFMVFICKEMMVFQSLMAYSSEGVLCGANVITANSGKTKGQVFLCALLNSFNFLHKPSTKIFIKPQNPSPKKKAQLRHQIT